ncbi:MAG: class I SAM-dependent methyltransferase [Bacteroidetes bacterium]|nr:class I SAM-dependent methyltransferase [Bacteroidota bacterium]MBL7104747.1 class I SAM-dependent methyltransferase [Bacteroidales bacterium]
MVEEHVCPIWVGYLLASPLRKMAQNPDKILSKQVKPGMKVIDIGCAMGFFSLPLARIVGTDGSVVCIDLQEKMIKTLKKKADRAKLADIIETRMCTSDSLLINDLAGQIDFALAFAVIHEVQNKENLFSEIYRVLQQGGKLLIAEPKGHVSKENFGRLIETAQNVGFKIIEHSIIKRSHAVLLKKNNPNILKS